MARINSLLSILVDQGANELRVGSDREPQLLAYGAPKKLTLPKLTDETLRDLLGEILSVEVAATMNASGRIEVAYDSGTFGAFKVMLTGRAGGLDAVFVKSARSKGAPAAPAPAPILPAEEIAPRETSTTMPASAPAAEPQSPSLNALMMLAASMRASDVHLADGEAPIVRVEGVLRRLDGESPADVASLLGSEEHRRLLRDRSIETAVDVAGIGRARVHAYTTQDGLAAAIRLLPPLAPSLDSLGMPVPFDDLIESTHGLVLVCGATGSGKSTTLAALAHEALRRRSIVLVTLEDPIEYALDAPGASVVRRRQVGRDVRDFATGLRDALREDPDVLLVGEMRDPETIALALTAAETGHLVLASIHSRGAASAIERIVDSYPAARAQQIRTQLAESLRAVIAQRLLPRARGGGRIPCVEVLRNNHAVSSLIREGRSAQIASAIQSGRKEGMISLERCLADRVQAGEIRLDDARSATNDPDSLTSYLAR